MPDAPGRSVYGPLSSRGCIHYMRCRGDDPAHHGFMRDGPRDPDLIMRSTADRIRHAISFEIIGLLLIIPLGAHAFAMPAVDIGVVGVASAVIALFWNYAFNLGFDHMLTRLAGTAEKGLALRLVHAVAFEIGLLAMLMPLIALYLGIDLWQAFLMDIGFSAFYMVYAFVFNWAYDLVFPLPRETAAAD